jgi:hypothetical protein
MGRPINKKFFGNLNSPYNRVPQNDTGTGGEWLDHVTVTTPGSYSVIPTVTVSTPDLDVESNTTATAAVTHMKAVSATVAYAGTGTTSAFTQPGYTLTAGDGGGATFTVQGVHAVGVIIRDLAHSGTGFHVGDIITLANSANNGPLGGTTESNKVKIQVTQVGSGVGEIQQAVIYQAGHVSTSEGTGPFNDYAHTGTGAGTRSFYIEWGVDTVSVATGGDYTVIPSQPISTTDTAGDTPPTLNVLYGVKTIGVVTTGSGYINAPSLTFTPTSAGATAYLSNTTNTSLNVNAWAPQLPDNTPNAEGSAIAGDIVKQESSRRYFVDTNQGHGQCRLVTTSTGNLTIGQMNLFATDVNGSTYFVEKLTAHKAYLVQYQVSGSFAYNNNQAARWTIGSASTGTVSIASD